MAFKNHKAVLDAVIICLVFSLDLLTKEFFHTSRSFDFGWIAFSLTKNTGASFGILKSFNIPIIVLSFFLLFGMGVLYRRLDNWNRLFLSLIAAGILGNLVNRIMYGYVIDFINLKWWPVFNVADSSIVTGVCGIILLSILEKKR